MYSSKKVDMAILCIRKIASQATSCVADASKR